MFGIDELLWGCGIALGFVCMFRLQRVFTPGYYFGAGAFVMGLRTNIKPLALIIRVLLVIAYAGGAYFLSGRSFPVYFGISLGSFLIVWPAITEPQAIEDPRLARRRWMLLAIYAVFIFSSVFFAHLAIVIEPAIRSTSSSYMTSLKEPDWWIDLFVKGALGSVLIAVFLRLLRAADREIALDLHQDDVEFSNSD